MGKSGFNDDLLHRKLESITFLWRNDFICTRQSDMHIFGCQVNQLNERKLMLGAEVVDGCTYCRYLGQ
jgi:hypothetical protein